MSDHAIALASLILAAVAAIFEAGIFMMMYAEFRKGRGDTVGATPRASRGLGFWRWAVMGVLSLGPLLAIVMIYLMAQNAHPAPVPSIPAPVAASKTGICLTKPEREIMENILCDPAQMRGSVIIRYDASVRSRGCLSDFFEAFTACKVPYAWQVKLPEVNESLADGVNIWCKPYYGGGRAKMAIEQANPIKAQSWIKQGSERLPEDVVIEIGKINIP
jgi:hypothetical protein